MIFRLNNSQSPYKNPECIDLIEIITKGKGSGINYNGTATADFIDYAVLIKNSKASSSIYNLKDK